MPSDVVTGDLAALASETLKSGQDGDARVSGRREIVLRVLSAVVLVPLGLYVVYAGGLVLIAATGLCAIVAGIEWARMTSSRGAGWVTPLVYAVLVIGAAAATYLGELGLGFVALACLVSAGLVALLGYLGKGSAATLAFGAIYTSLPFGAFVWIREHQPDGRLFLFAILAVVWATDIAAYFAGRGFGGPLLSPKDSPNKTWTGAIGAVVCACLAGVAVARAAGGPFVYWLAFSLLLSVVAQAGDLLESRFKRLYGVKDTSGIVPGHGGVLDRLDALMAAVVVAALLLQFTPFLVPGFSLGGPQ
ncbi:MAG: phosphatidate cytidylyltransferase [Alphaproteobacteria bacterium]|nr:phosphatidate cytidylyltransferase [Alphaproteobacteria bacterium]